MAKVLTKNFFRRDAEEVARDILGKYLVRKINGQNISVQINEVEVYDGFDDLASHASKGKTPRTEIMFGEGGFFYIYLIYGMYWMVNIVTGKSDHPSAILIRGGKEESTGKILNGPGKLSKHLKIDKSFNKLKAVPDSHLWFEDRNFRPQKITQTPRIGVLYAGPIWSKKKLRFVYDC